jgi:hypothetical protein
MMARIFRGGGALAIATVQTLIIGAMLALPVTASQAPLFNPTSGSLPGLTMVQNFNTAIDAVASCNSGGSSPTAQFLSGAASLGNCWLNTTNNSVNIYDGTNWNTVAWVDAVNHLIIGQIGGGGQSTVASASTANLCGALQANIRGSNVLISGTTTITSFGSNCFLGQVKLLTFGAAATLTYNATSMILPTGASITTAAGDTAVAIYLGTGNWQVLFYQRATGAALSSVGLSVGANALGSSALGFNLPVNLGLAVSENSHALTVSLTGANGSAPSSLNPVLIPFRSTTFTTGTPTVDSLQSSLGLTIASGNTMGCVSNVACRIWIYAIDNGGTVALGLMVCSTSTQIFSCGDDLLYNTPSGTSGGSSAGTLYGSTGSLSGAAVRMIGYLEATESTAGTWDTMPSKLQLFGPGVHKPGDIVQTVFFSSASGGATTSSSPAVAWSSSITPTSVINLVAINATVSGFSSPVTSAQVISQIYRGSTALWAALQIGNSNVNGEILGSNTFNLLDNPGTTSAQTYNVEIYRGGSSGTVTYTAGTIMLQEIMGALDEPANDDGSPQRLVG